MTKLIHTIFCMRQAYATGDVVVNLIAHALGELGIKLRAMTLQLNQVPGRREVRAVTCGMPRRTCRQLVTLQQHTVFHSELCQMIKSTAAHGSTTNNHHLRLRLHSVHHSKTVNSL